MGPFTAEFSMAAINPTVQLTPEDHGWDKTGMAHIVSVFFEADNMGCA
jgi:hypothetical protein